MAKECTKKFDGHAELLFFTYCVLDIPIAIAVVIS